MSEEEKFVRQYVSDPAELEEPLPPPRGPKRIYFSTANNLLKHAGKYSGDDLEYRLREVYSSRGEAEF